MKKIFQIASYDFRRLMFNPITLAVMGVLMLGCLMLSLFYKIPTTPTYSAITRGENAIEIYENFNSDNSEIDTKKMLDALLKSEKSEGAKGAKDILDIMAKDSEYDDFQTLTKIKAEFDAIEEVFSIPQTFYDYEPKYLKENDISEIVNAAEHLEKFVQDFEKKGTFESKLFFTKQNFEKLKQVSQYFSSITKSGKTIKEIVDDIYLNKDKFKQFSPSELTSTWWADDEKLEMLTIIVTSADEKVQKIYKEIEAYSNSSSEAATEKIKNLITNYKLTCESTYFVVKGELTLSLDAHFSNLENLQNYSKLENKEDLQQDIAKAKFLIEDKNLEYTAWQEPLNFNVASNKATTYDSAYFVISIIGFLTIIFAIFCAYKLFGRDRRNGKMDVILSQNVTFGQAFAGKFLAIVFCTSFALAFFLILSLLFAIFFNPTLPYDILAVFNLSTPYTLHPILFLLIKVVGIELQAIFWAMGTIFLMNISRKFELTFAIALAIFAASVVCNIFLNGILVYCLFPFVHIDLTAFLGGGSMKAGFLQTALYSNGNFFISLAYYVVVVVLLYNFTNQLFKKN